MTRGRMLGLGKTPWVDRSLRAQWPELQQSVEGDLLPRPLPSPSGRARRQLVVDEFGCGAFGCVMPTNRPGVVVKITGDASEAWFASAAIALAARDGWPVGIVRYYDVRPMHATHRGRPLFLLWRQEAQDVDYMAQSHSLFFGPLASNLQEFKAFAGRVYQLVRKSRNSLLAAERLQQTLRMHGDQIYDVVSARLEWAGNGDRVRGITLRQFIAMSKASPAVDVRACEVIAEHMQNTYGQQTIGEALGYYLDHGLLLADVHPGNVGMAEHPDYGRPVETITDPGLAVAIKPEWFTFHVGGSLPPGI